MPIPKNKIKEVLTHEDSFATTLITLLIDIYGTEFLDWSPTTILLETEDDFGFEWPQANFDRLMAGCALLKSNSFYKNLPDFIDLCNILSGSPATPGSFDPADTMECAWGITEALLLSPPEEDVPFTEEIRAYIGKVCEMEGIINPPDILKIAILSDDHKTRVSNDYTDDPEMFSMIWQTEKEKTDDINAAVKDSLTRLVTQLSLLSLEHGNTAAITQKMMTNLGNLNRS